MKVAGIFFLLFACLCAPALAQSGDEGAIQSKIVALEQLWNQAYKSADIKALDSILAENIVLANDDGSVQTKTEFLASVKSAAPQPTAQQQQVAPGVPFGSRLRKRCDRNGRHARQRH